MTTHKTLPEKIDEGLFYTDSIYEGHDRVPTPGLLLAKAVNMFIDFLSQAEESLRPCQCNGRIKGGEHSLIHCSSSQDENGVIDYGSKSQNEAFNVPQLPQTELLSQKDSPSALKRDK